MAVKQTAGRTALGEFAPKLMYFSVRYGVERINSL